MSNSRLPKKSPLSKAQHSDCQIEPGAPVQTPPSLESPSPIEGVTAPSGNPSQPLTTITLTLDRPVQPSVFPFDQVPCDPELELEAAAAPPPTPVHEPLEPQPPAPLPKKSRKPRKIIQGPRVNAPPVRHTEANHRLIEALPSHLRSLIRFHFGNSEALQVVALNLIYQYLREGIHICYVDRRDDSAGGMIIRVTCGLCPPPRISFGELNALQKFAHHFRTVHCDIKSPFSCILPACDKHFSRQHDMTRHIRGAHPEWFTGTAGVEDNIPQSVVASTSAGPSNSRGASKPSSRVVVPRPRHYKSPSPPPPPPSRSTARMNPYPPQTTLPAPRAPYWDTTTTSQPNPSQTPSTSSGGPTRRRDGGGGGSSRNAPGGSRRSPGRNSGYVSSVNASWADQQATSQPSRSFQNPHVDPFGASHHPAEVDAEEAMRYFDPYTRSLPPPPFTLDGVPYDVPSGAPGQIRSDHQRHPSRVVPPLTGHEYPPNIMPDNPFHNQNRMVPPYMMPPYIQGSSHHPIPSHATARDVTGQWRSANGTEMDHRSLQHLRNEANYLATQGDGGLYDPLDDQRQYIRAGTHDHMPPMSFQPPHPHTHVALTQQHQHHQPQPQPQPQRQHQQQQQQQQRQHPFQGQAEPSYTHYHNLRPPYTPEENPQTSENMGAWTFLRSPAIPTPTLEEEDPQTSSDVGAWIFSRPPPTPTPNPTPEHIRARPTRQTVRIRRPPNPNHHPHPPTGANVSLARGPLAGVVGRHLPPWFGLIRLVVGVSKAFVDTILVVLLVVVSSLGKKERWEVVSLSDVGRAKEEHTRSRSDAEEMRL